MRSVVMVTALIALVACGRYTEPRVFTDALRAVPDVAGETVERAVADLEDEGFLVTLQSVASPAEASIDPARCRTASVARTDPRGGERVVKATTVTLVVERCP